MRRAEVVVALLGAALLLVGGCDGDSHHGAPTATATTRATSTPISVTPTALASATPIASRSNTPTAAASHTMTGSPSATPTVPATATASALPSETPTVPLEQSPTATPFDTPTASPTASATSSPTFRTGATEPATPSATPSETPTMCPFSPTPGASATTTGTATATYTALICPAESATPTPAGACTATASPTSTGTRPPPSSTPTPGLAILRLYDANPRYTSDVFLPLADYSAASVGVLTTPAWSDAARQPLGAAADGVSLLLVSVQLLGGADDTPVRLQITQGSGALYAVDDQSLIDRSPEGGHIDDPADAPSELLVDPVVVGGERWAFALYRAPRDFAGTTRSYPATLSAFQDELLLNELSFSVFRPLVIFLHGTGGDTSNWDQFALWSDSANELTAFAGGDLPFFADRISFQWISLAGGHLTDNAATILPQIGRALESWKLQLNIAATQADVVTHSYGGPTARQVAQTQPDADPLTTADQANFRAATNWGHGSIRKLVTLAATHRGSALSNSVAYLNQLRDGALRTALCIDGFDIAAGALGDQVVLSPALRGLQETRLPGHAVVGSGTVQFADTPRIAKCNDGSCEVCYDGSGYHGEYTVYQSQDVSTGPYQGAGDLGGTICGFNFFCENFDYDSYARLTNYMFNLSYAQPFPYPDCDLSSAYPDYDLTVSACSSRGQQPSGAFSTAADIDPSLVGHLSHMQLLHTPAVSERVQFVLEQPTTSDYFADFAATGEPTCLEEQLMSVGSATGLTAGTACASGPDDPLINSCYDSCNSCEATSDTPPCFVEYQVVPAPLVLRQLGQAAPVFVYGRVARGPLDGQWTNVQSLANGIWCAVTMSSENSSVAAITTWSALSGVPDQSGIDVIQAVGDGQTAVALSVQGKFDGTLSVDVTVDTTPPAAPD